MALHEEHILFDRSEKPGSNDPAAVFTQVDGIVWNEDHETRQHQPCQTVTFLLICHPAGHPWGVAAHHHLQHYSVVAHESKPFGNHTRQGTRHLGGESPVHHDGGIGMGAIMGMAGLHGMLRRPLHFNGEFNVYMTLAALSGCLLLVGFLAFFYNIVMTLGVNGVN